MTDCRTYYIDFDQQEVHEAGAMLVTLLAYPRDDKEETGRGNLHASLCASVLRASFGNDPVAEGTPQLMKPIHAFRDLQLIWKDLRILRRRLQDRMAAARMAMAYLKEAATGQIPKLPPGIKRLSLNQLSEMVLADTRESMPENVEVRIWRASLPVIHLASATAMLADICERDGINFSIADLLVQRDLIEWVVRAAEEYATLLQRSRRKIDPARLLKILLV
jgi:hypothetical protein